MLYRVPSQVSNIHSIQGQFGFGSNRVAADMGEMENLNFGRDLGRYIYIRIFGELNSL